MLTTRARVTGPRRTPRRAALALLAVGMLLAGCGSDDDTSGSDATSPPDTAASATDVSAFCNGLIEGEQLFNQGPETDPAGMPTPDGLADFESELRPLLDDIEQNAPAELSSEVSTVLAGVNQALESGDPSSTEEPAFMEADMALDGWAYENCELDEQVELVAAEYEYRDAPDSIGAGTVGLQLQNEGKEVHEAVVVRISDDTDLSVDQLIELPEEQVEQYIEFAGVVIADPESSGSSIMTLEPGRYAIVCFIPVGTTSMDDAMAAMEGEGSSDAMPHAARGMFHEFTVT